VDAILGTRPSSAPVTLLQSGSSTVLLEFVSLDGKVNLIMILLYSTIVDETQVPSECDGDDMTYVPGYTQDENIHSQD